MVQYSRHSNGQLIVAYFLQEEQKKHSHLDTDTRDDEDTDIDGMPLDDNEEDLQVP